MKVFIVTGKTGPTTWPVKTHLSEIAALMTVEDLNVLVDLCEEANDYSELLFLDPDLQISHSGISYYFEELDSE